MIINKKLSYSLLYNLANAGFPLLTLPFVFRALPPDTYGDIVFWNVIYQALTALFIFSLTSYGIREYKRNKEQCVKEIFTLQCIYTFISLFIYMLISFLFEKYTSKHNSYEFVFILCIFSSAFYSDWALFAEQEYKKLFFRTIIVKGLLFCLVILFVKEKNDALIYAFILGGSYISNNILAFYFAKTMYKLKYKIEVHNLLKYIAKTKYFLSSASVGISYQYLDQFLAGVLLNNTALAYFNILKQIIAMLTTLPITICRFKQPIVSKVYLNIKNIKEYHKGFSIKYTALVISIFILYITLGTFFLNLFVGHKFEISSLSVVISGMIFITSCVSVYLDTQHSIPLSYEKVTFMGNVVLSLTYLSSMYIAATLYSYNGMLISYFIAELISMIVIIIYYTYNKGKWYVVD
ncbi:oligosaccharide flippase family protein [Photobacterium phosphoreum]|uniref:oligosaccharide flippase family protein n=1 Tax=Photobacterium phosphoreum TaxID=659 RepID=UPI001E327881|nr:oligosaccharide flippase family protein [Photobacterium phosphoreum]MCD9504173.1 oligosaccharide flippase family protein [Photobacterium phosphoreum]